MRLTSCLLVGVAMLAGSAQADKLVTVEGCDAGLDRVCGFYYAHWHTNNAGNAVRIDARDGCRSNAVPGMVEFCIDWGNSRGHFRFSSDANRRCFVRGATQWFADGDCWGIECWRTEWPEVACIW